MRKKNNFKQKQNKTWTKTSERTKIKRNIQQVVLCKYWWCCLFCTLSTQTQKKTYVSRHNQKAPKKENWTEKKWYFPVPLAPPPLLWCSSRRKKMICFFFGCSVFFVLLVLVVVIIFFCWIRFISTCYNLV